ncbi:hypothetical protein V8C40DRAFT_9650 [Trichoderma camerunense]
MLAPLSACAGWKPSQSLQGHSILPTCLDCRCTSRISNLFTWTSDHCRAFSCHLQLSALVAQLVRCTVSINALRIQSVCAVSLASCWHRWTIVRRRFSSTRSVFPSPRVCEKLPAWFEPTAEIKDDLRCIAIRWALPLVDIKMELSSLSSLFLRATFIIWGKPPNCRYRKRGSRKTIGGGGSRSGGTPYRGVNGRSRWRFFQWLVLAAGYGGYVR